MAAEETKTKKKKKKKRNERGEGIGCKRRDAKSSFETTVRAFLRVRAEDRKLDSERTDLSTGKPTETDVRTNGRTNDRTKGSARTED